MWFHRSRSGTSRRPSWAQPLCMELRLRGEGRGAWRISFRRVSTAFQRRFFPYPLSGMRVFSLQGREVQASKVQIFHIEVRNIQVRNLQVRKTRIDNQDPQIGRPGRSLPRLQLFRSSLCCHTLLPRGCLLALLLMLGAFTP